MTRYILAGGNDFAVEDYAKKLNVELSKIGTNLKVLSCFYSRSADEWDQESIKWESWFKEKLDNIKSHTVAGLDTLEQQVLAADVVYFHGGNTKLLLEKLMQYKDLKTMLKNKTIIGSSAGANMLAKNYWSSTFQEPGKGRGIVDVSIMVHYGARNFAGIYRSEQDWQNEEIQLREFIGHSGAEEKIYHIPEGTFVSFGANEDNGR